MHKPSMTYRLIINIIILAAFLVGGWVLMRVNGYRLYYPLFRLEKTGVISLKAHPKTDVDVWLNSKKMPINQFDFTDLAPGRYSVKLVKQGFSSWEETFVLAAGQAAIYDHIVLFKEKIELLPIIDKVQIESDQKLLAQTDRFDSGILVEDGEIWANDLLVTRYSMSVKQALWFPDQHHLLVLLKNELHIIDKTGGHDLLLVKLPDQDAPIHFIPQAGGEKILISSGENYYLAEITDPYSLVNF